MMTEITLSNEAADALLEEYMAEKDYVSAEELKQQMEDEMYYA